MRVPLDLAALVAEVKPDTIRKWVMRGHIGKYPDGYETTEIFLWLDQTRKVDQAIGAKITQHKRYQKGAA